MRCVVVGVFVSLAMAGCAARGTATVPPAPAVPVEARATPASTRPQADSLEAFMAKVRTLAAEARPQRAPAATVEGSDPRLAAALALSAFGSAEPAIYRAVADEYLRLRIIDKAHEYLNKALKLDPGDAATHEALARLWRDWGFPNLALGDAYRAVYYAPSSAAVRNTLGTIFQALGQRESARAQYQRALLLDPTAAYALNNLCYGWVLDGQSAKAVAACLEALEIAPHLEAARNNLGLAYAVAGDLDAARAAFDEGGDRARALYNEGIVRLARRQYADAVKAFREAQALRPGTRLTARLRQAERLAATGGGD